MPTVAMRELVHAVRAKSRVAADASLWGIAPDAFGFEAHPPTFVVDVRNWIGRKLAALRCHRTQIGPQNPLAAIDEADARRWLAIAQFRRAPTDTSGRPGLALLGAKTV